MALQEMELQRMAPWKALRKILTPVSPRQLRKNHRSNAGSSEMTDPVAGNRSLSSAQLHLATYLAVACPHSQRPHAGLLADMERKRKLKDSQASEATESEDTEFFSSQSPLGPQPVPFLRKHPACGPDWRTRAETRLRRARISLDKEWSSKTWSNKTNVPERLFLLEADGFDINPLQRSSISSAQVTEAVMSRIKERKELGKFPNRADSQRSQEQTHPTGAIQPPAESVTCHVPFAENEIEYLFDEHEYRPRVSVDRKRKRCKEEASNNDLAAASRLCENETSEGRLRKKIRVQTANEVESAIHEQSLVLFRKNVIRQIFAHTQFPSLGSHKTPLVNINIHLSLPQGEYKDLYDRFGPNLLRISSRGYESLMNEMKFLADGRLERAHCDDFSISDPDFEEQRTLVHGFSEITVTETSDDRHPRVISGLRRRIHVRTTDTECIIAGDAPSMEGLLKRLQENDLLHTSEWVFDGLTVVPESNITWSLSNETQCLLAEIRQRLQADDCDEARNIHVIWVYVGEAGHV
jgi:hypothetical protein